MGYFSNGTEGDFYQEEYCFKCQHWSDEKGCPIWGLHLNYNYKMCNEPDSFLDELIPRNRELCCNSKCKMFVKEPLSSHLNINRGNIQMSKPRLLDLFCGAGGAAMGYYRAGFEVVGVDIKPQPHYPFEFHQSDALTYPLEGFDAYHGSPPCQHASRANQQWRKRGYDYPALIEPIRIRLKEIKKPFVIENVIGSTLINPCRLTGVMFGLQVIRARLFETSFEMPMYFEVKPHRKVVYYQPFGHGSLVRPCENPHKWAEAMGIDWMNKYELTQAIPPAYTEYIGKYLMQVVLSNINRRETPE